MREIGSKSVESFEIKDADRGEVVAVVSRFDVVDRDRDVVLSGAIPDGVAVKLSAYGHDVIKEGKPPVGKGIIRVEGDRAVLYAKYFMSTERGRDAFAQVKEMGSDSEWSAGFWNDVGTVPMTPEWRAKGARRLIAKMEVVESSPVFIAANQYTSTVAVKEALEADALDVAVLARIESMAESITQAAVKQITEQVATERQAALDAKAEQEQQNADAALAEAARVEAEQTEAVKAAEAELATKAAAEAAQVQARADRVRERFQQTFRSLR